MPKEVLGVYRDKTKSEYYIRHGRRKWEDLYPSVQYFLAQNDLKGEKVLEVGCAAGGMVEIMKDRYGSVDYTGMDVGPAEIEHAREAYPHARFFCGDFLKNKLKAGSYDTVCAFQVVNHQPRYRKFITELFRAAKRRVIFDARFQYHFPTVVDLDASYLYYHGSGKRNYFIPFNFYEIFNFLHLDFFRAKKISVYGYYAPNKSSAFVCVPKSKMIAGAFCVEKYAPGEKVERWGGRPEFANRGWCEYEIDLPDFSMKDI